jgi:hypothetical protein
VKLIEPYHHYSTERHGERLPIEALEEEVVQLLLSSDVPDARRDSSISFELKHSSGVLQFARVMARKRHLPVDVCAAGALLHDVFVIVSGSYQDHAHRGAPIARRMIEGTGGFTDQQIKSAETIVYDHSDKHIVSADPFAEFGKDVDVLDSFLYPGAFDWYLANKPLDVFQHYLVRARSVWSDLGLAPDPGFALLDGYSGNWLDAAVDIDVDDRVHPTALPADTPPFLITSERGIAEAWYSTDSWRRLEGKGSRVRNPVVERLKEAARAILALSHIREPGLATMVWPAIARYEIIPKSSSGVDRLAALAPSAVAPKIARA